MPDAVAEHAPAKVNLALHVTGRRADGYHLLDTLVVFAEAGDRIRAEPAGEDRFSIGGPFADALQGGGENLVLRARDLLRKTAGYGPPVAITLEKSLPVASGIGGGSSDAAAALRALTRLWGLTTTPETLQRAALTLGADLPMCLAASTLVARGIGESLEAVSGLPRLAMVLVNPGVAVATPAVFRALAHRGNPPLPPLPSLPVRPSFAALADWLAGTRNDLEAPAVSLAPETGAALAALRAAGAAFSRMSGSGATCFGLYASDAEAARAAAAIAAGRPSWYVKATRTIEKAQADGAH